MNPNTGDGSSCLTADLHPGVKQRESLVFDVPYNNAPPTVKLIAISSVSFGSTGATSCREEHRMYRGGRFFRYIRKYNERTVPPDTRDTVFSLLPTTCPIPVKIPFGSIFYYSPVIADRQAHRGYVHGIDKDNRHYVLCVEYDKTPAPLTLYYTDPLPEAGFPEIVLTDDGNLMIVGGITYNKGLGGSMQNDNFSPLATVFLLHVSNHESAEASVKWPWIILALIVIAMAVAVCLILILKRCHRQPSDNQGDRLLDCGLRPNHELVPSIDAPDANGILMQRICDLMKQQQPYLNSDLKLTDLAAMLGTNRNAISSCINSQRGCSFSQFINGYRVSHAQKLMRSQPDVKISEVWMQSGFSTETSFFRTFKAATGKTPSEWKSTFLTNK